MCCLPSTCTGNDPDKSCPNYIPKISAGECGIGLAQNRFRKKRNSPNTIATVERGYIRGNTDNIFIPDVY